MHYIFYEGADVLPGVVNTDDESLLPEQPLPVGLHRKTFVPKVTTPGKLKTYSK